MMSPLVMERAAVIGGVDGASCILAAKLLGREPSGTVPHAAFLIVGDSVKVAEAYDEFMPDDAPRIILVDTFKDEAEESLRVGRSPWKETDRDQVGYSRRARRSDSGSGD